MSRASGLCSVVVVSAAVFGGCGDGPSVDCDALCARTLACEVTFAPSDDPEELKVASGERSEEESCALGCGESPVVTVEHASCVDGLDIVVGDPGACQNDVLTCVELPTE